MWYIVSTLETEVISGGIMPIEFLEEIARERVGDGQKPNVFFVSEADKGVVLITTLFNVAYDFWKSLPRNKESMLEDRLTGTICSVEPESDSSSHLIFIDDSRRFGFRV